MAVKPIPEGYHTVSPYLIVEGVAKEIEFLKRAFGATEGTHTKRPDGAIAHAEVRIGDSVVMMGEAMEGFPPMPAMLYVYVNDADETYRRAIEAGATSLEEPADAFYGDRRAGVKDAAGNLWYVATHQEDVPPEEMQKRADAEMRRRAGSG